MVNDRLRRRRTQQLVLAAENSSCLVAEQATPFAPGLAARRSGFGWYGGRVVQAGDDAEPGLLGQCIRGVEDVAVHQVAEAAVDLRLDLGTEGSRLTSVVQIPS